MTQKHAADYETRTLSVTLHGSAWAQLEDLLANSDGPALDAPAERTIDKLATALLAAWADGWRRPGSWERQMLVMSGHADG